MAGYRFGSIEVRPGERRVLVSGTPAALGARAFDLLVALIENRDRAMTKDELLALVWPGVVVEENNLQVQVSALRKVLGAGAISTLPGRGYRFTLVPEAAPPPPAAPRRHNLPAELTSFVGREAEMVQVRGLLGESRLVTLTGAGGTGKTRLARQAAAASLSQFPDGAWLVELAPVADEGHVALVIATALGIAEGDLAGHVAERHLLILLDNCEHLLRGCADAARRLLQASPGVRILATSREPLHVTGESTYRVQTLPEPHAIQLFVDRAHAANPSLTPEVDHSAAVAEICKRLDGMPLAIELAAARVRALSVAKIAERLDDRFRLLSGGDATAMPHQQTLRASIDWSYDLLSAPERALLRRLSVFAGGCTLEAAEAVCDDNLIAVRSVMELLANLVEKSLVQHDAGVERYLLLESVREYALEQLKASEEEVEAHDRHVAYFLGFTSRAHREIIGPDQAAWMSRLDHERENIFAAAAWCRTVKGGGELVMRLLASIKPYWLSRGLFGRVRGVFLELLPHFAPGTRARARTLYDVGQMGYWMGLLDEARAQLEESLAISRERGDRTAMGQVLQPLGVTCMGQGDLAAARGHLSEALEIAGATGDPRNILAATNALAQLHHVQGDLAAAEPLYEEVLARARESRDRESVAIALLNLAMTSIDRQDGARARSMLSEALEIAAASGSKPVGQSVLDICSGLAALERVWEYAARFHGAAEAEAQRTGIRRAPADEAFLAPRISTARGLAGETAFASVEASGRELSYDQALAAARAWLQPSG